MKRPTPPVTQALIARTAGVSQATVSAILSGSDSLNIGDETRANILAIAERLGYVIRKPLRKPAASPSPESTARQSVLIVESSPITDTSKESWLESAYQTLMGKILTSSSFHLRAHNLGLSLFHLDEPKALMQWLTDSDIGGVIWHANDSDSSILHWVASRHPLVLINRQWQSSAVSFDSVSVDQEKNMTIALEHLWARGHRRICTFGHAPTNSFFRRRVAAYKDFTSIRGLRDYVEFQALSDAPEVPAATKVEAILSTWKSLGSEAPTALVTSDVFALPLLREARRAGIDVPAQLSVVGIDNTSACELVDPPLTSLEESFGEMCRVAVDLLVRRMASRDAPGCTVQIAPRLVERRSVHDLSAAPVADRTAAR